MHKTASKIIESGAHIISDHSVLDNNKALERDLRRGRDSFIFHRLVSAMVGCAREAEDEETFSVLGDRAAAAIDRLHQLKLLDSRDRDVVEVFSSEALRRAIEFSGMMPEGFDAEAA
jgi:hypothetical protein